MFDVIFFSINDRQLIFDEKIQISYEQQKTMIFIDIDVSIIKFVNVNFVKQHKLTSIFLMKFMKLRLIDDNLISNITHAI